MIDHDEREPHGTNNQIRTKVLGRRERQRKAEEERQDGDGDLHLDREVSGAGREGRMAPRLSIEKNGMGMIDQRFSLQNFQRRYWMKNRKPLEKKRTKMSRALCSNDRLGRSWRGDGASRKRVTSLKLYTERGQMNDHPSGSNGKRVGARKVSSSKGLELEANRDDVGQGRHLLPGTVSGYL